MIAETMKKVVLYDPAVSSLNLGDHIISHSCKRELAPILDGAFTIEISSHLPVSRYLSYIGDVDHKFVCGSNLLRGKMNSRFRQWDVTPRYARMAGPAVLLGVGWWQYGDGPNAYTKWLYSRILATDAYHSVRDEYTASRMRAMGFRNVINTSCPTMWRLDERHCAAIPTTMGERVVTTVTDYNKDPIRDRQMLMVLAGLYRSVSVWLQGTGDMAYLQTLSLPRSSFTLIPPTLRDFDSALGRDDTDYVGTRLHAGIRALQHGRRSLIIGVDNRAAEKNRDFNLTWLPRDEIFDLNARLRGKIVADIRIPSDRIEKWKSQFSEFGAR